MTKQSAIPPHQWTYNGDRVLILKCVNADMTSYGGFVWPESGTVRPDKFSREPTCESGGLFGWPWGLALGDGKEPVYAGKWIVFSAHPDDVIDCGGKCKAIPNDDELGRTIEVVFVGEWQKALEFIRDGHIAWVSQASSASSATGESSASSATGYRSASSATGDRSASSATGYSSASSATGDRSIAAGTCEDVTIEILGTGLAAVTADVFYWIWRKEAVVCQRTPKGVFLLQAADVPADDGEKLRVEHGVISRLPKEAKS